MKIAQYYTKEGTGAGFIDGNTLYPVKMQGDVSDMIASGQDFIKSGEGIPLENIRFAPPISRPSKIIGIGLNYMDHIREGSAGIPEIPMVFAKFQNSLVGHGGTITWTPSLTKQVDFEAELAIVIGKTLHECPEERVLEGIFGYTCANDVSARDIQFGDGQWVRGKSLDTFCPLGPWIVTSDEIRDPHSLNIRCLLNGRIMQDGNTEQMLFKIPRLISFLSKNFTLIPGDIILTGTPSGVGCFREPPVFLKDGDVIAVEIEKVGRLENHCRTH